MARREKCSVNPACTANLVHRQCLPMSQCVAYSQLELADVQTVRTDSAVRSTTSSWLWWAARSERLLLDHDALPRHTLIAAMRVLVESIPGDRTT